MFSFLISSFSLFSVFVVRDMRALSLSAWISVPAAAGIRSYGTGGVTRPPPNGRHLSVGGASAVRGGVTMNEPQLIVRLLEHFPLGKTAIPIAKWAPALPDELQEALVLYGGLGSFANSQSNFFIVRKENGVNVVALSSMGLELCIERNSIEKQTNKRIGKVERKKDKFPPTRRDGITGRQPPGRR